MGLMGKEGFPPNIYTYNAIIDNLCKKGSFDETYRLLHKGSVHGLQADGVTYTIFMSVHYRQADTNRALVFFNKMPDIHAYTTLISALCRQKQMKESERLFEEAVSLGLIPTKKTYTSMICGYCRYGITSLAVKLFQRMSNHGCFPDNITYGALISGLCK